MNSQQSEQKISPESETQIVARQMDQLSESLHDQEQVLESAHREIAALEKTVNSEIKKLEELQRKEKARPEDKDLKFEIKKTKQTLLFLKAELTENEARISTAIAEITSLRNKIEELLKHDQALRDAYRHKAKYYELIEQDLLESNQ